MKFKIFRLLVMLAVLLGLAACGGKPTSQRTYPGEVWQRTETPGELEWSSEKLAKARAYSERIGSAAVMIVDDGIVVDSWGDITRNFMCHSVRKSLLSALIGIHVDESHIDLSKTMEELGIDDNEPSLTATEKQATVGDLIKARSGVYHVALGEAPSMKAARPERYSHAPGTFWYYNNWDFNALGTIFEQETGTKIFEEFDRRIAKPLQMEDFEVDDCWYGTGPESIHSYYGFRMSARDLARFGLLFLREGRWRDQQIIPADWVKESTSTHSQTDHDSGYGYMWWTGVKGGLFPNVEVKECSFYASGYRGHKVIVLPYRNLVIVHRVDTDQPDPSVEIHQIGTLLWLILDAAGEREIGESPFIESAKGVRLTGEDLRETLVGSTLQGTTGSGEILASISRDGSISVSLAGSLIDKGKWWTEDDKLCVQFTNPDLEGGCSLVMLDGTTIKLFDLDGTLNMKFEYSRD